MHHLSLFNLVALAMPAVTFAAPLEASVLEVRASIGDIANAQNTWQQDTSVVSQFLSAAPHLRGADLVNRARTALNAEKDELKHKAVLDSVFVFVSNPNRSVQQANNILVDQGTFQFVVNGLTDIVNNGAKFSSSQIASKIASINRDRCQRVLPAIDTYFRASAAVVKNGVTLNAARPNNC